MSRELVWKSATKLVKGFARGKFSPVEVVKACLAQFDGVRAEIHPYDVTVETDGRPEAYVCKWGARGIGADVLNQLDDARRHAAEDGARLTAVLVVFDALRTCQVRLARQTAPRQGLRMVTIETLDRMAGR